MWKKWFKIMERTINDVRSKKINGNRKTTKDVIYEENRFIIKGREKKFKDKGL